MCKEPRQCAGFFILGPVVDKLLNLSSQLLNQLDSIATSLAIIARALQDMAGQGQEQEQEAEPDDSPAQSVYLDD